MRILVHDYAGHPFQVQLSRELALRGDDVIHLYFAENPGPKGSLAKRPGDSPSLHFQGVSMGKVYDKTNMITRRFNDVEYGKRVSRIIQDFSPHVVISGNTPTEAQKAIVSACKLSQSRFIYWVQDFYSIAVSTFLTKKLGFVGSSIGWYYRHMERQQLRASDAVVVITEDFVPLASSWGGDHKKVHVIENWGALDDLPVGNKDNAWSRQHGLHDDFAFVYSGTLALKHNPQLLISLAQVCQADTKVVAAAEGVGVARLAAVEPMYEAMRLLPLQPISQLADVLATADVLIANIEEDAGSFAGPSKVLSYLCAGRPILLSAPKQNLAARIVTQANAGIVTDPGDGNSFVAAAMRLRSDHGLRETLGANGRAYAEKTFDMERITDRFIGVISETVAR